MAAAQLAHQGRDQLVAAEEVAVDDRGRDPGSLGHGADPNGVHALPGQQLRRGLENLGAALRGREPQSTSRPVVFRLVELLRHLPAFLLRAS